MTGLSELVVLAGSLLAAVSWLFVVLAAPTGPSQMPPARGVLITRAWLYAPFWVPMLLVSATMLPGIVGSLLHGDHCLSHELQHHLCLVHPPHAARTDLAWMIGAGLLLPMLAAMLGATARILREARLLRSLVRLSRPSDVGSDVRILDQAEPVAMTVGWRRPTILVSTGLLSRITPRALAVVLAHERAHVARRDTRAAVLDRVAASIRPRAVGDPLRERLALAREQLCDGVAATAAGGRLEVARTLAEVLRLAVTAPPGAASISSGAMEARVALLLRPPRSTRRWALGLVAVVAGLVALGVGPLHGAAERLISALIH